MTTTDTPHYIAPSILDDALEAMAGGQSLSDYADTQRLPHGPLRLRLMADDYASRFERAYDAWMRTLPEASIKIADQATTVTERVCRLRSDARARAYQVYTGAKAGQQQSVKLEVVVKRELPATAYLAIPGRVDETANPSNSQGHVDSVTQDQARQVLALPRPA